MKARFKVQHHILSGLKYVQVVKRMGVSNKMQEMIVSCPVTRTTAFETRLMHGQGSYSPNTTDKQEYEKKCMSPPLHAHHCLLLIRLVVESETAPSGMLARGHYNAVSKFIDDDQVTHLKFEWSFDIKKDW